MPYENYKDLFLKIPVGKNGDCYDRYTIRIEEMRQSLLILQQCIRNVPDGLYKEDNHKINTMRMDTKNDMVGIIQHFKVFSGSLAIAQAENYIASEAPKGEFGVYLCTNNTNKAMRCKIKAPGFLHLQGVNMMSAKHLLADVVAIIGTADIVFGEADR